MVGHVIDRLRWTWLDVEVRGEQWIKMKRSRLSARYHWNGYSEQWKDRAHLLWLLQGGWGLNSIESGFIDGPIEKI